MECGIFGINKAVPSVVVINWKLMTGSQEGVGQGKTGAIAGIGAFGEFFGLLLSLAIPILEGGS